MIGKVIYDILSNDASVAAIVGTRIYPVVASQGAANPCLVYNLDSTPEDDKDGSATIFYIDVQVDCYTDDLQNGTGGYGQAEDLGDKVVAALDRYSGTNNGYNIDTVILFNREDFYDQEAQSFRSMIEVRVRLKV